MATSNFPSPDEPYYQMFSAKAATYAQYRWDYHPEAIAAMVKMAGITQDSVVADVGSGTGMLTAHLVSQVKQIYAIEPNEAMRAIALQNLAPYPAFISIDAFADATTLPDASVDLIVVGRAIHWFNRETTKAEFGRILKPEGWLAICRIPDENSDFLAAIQGLKKAEYGWNMAQDRFELTKNDNLINYYFSSHPYTTIKYPARIQENWSSFLNRLLSLSPAPKEDNPLFELFQKQAKKVFQAYSQQGILTLDIATEITLGKL